MTCSTCDGYELVPGADGMLVSCSDCPKKVRCPRHGRIVYTGEKCCECLGEARTGLEILVDLNRAAVAAARERSVIAA